MKVCGFSFIRNAKKFDYPIKEALQSILPICDKIIVAVGNSEDNTRELVTSIAPNKIEVIDTVWDDSLREGGRVLAVETDKAFQAIPNKYDWVFYIQGDEVLHEKYLPIVKSGMEKYKDHKEVDGLLFNYCHFYGSYDYVGVSSSWYRNEIRIIRNNKHFYSYKDAQGFRKYENEKLNVKLLDAYVYHYGWVKDPRAQQQKQETFHKLWHDDNWVDKHIVKADEFDYSTVDALQKFMGTHPEVMLERIAAKNWQFDYDLSKGNFSRGDRFRKFIERVFNFRIGEHKNYKII